MYQADRINQPSPGRDSECGYRRTRHRRSSLRRRNQPGESGTTHFHTFLFCIISIASYELSCDPVWTDGMDRDDSYPDQSCPMADHHRGTMAESHWEDHCSSASICSQSSDEEMKPMGHSKGELYPPGGDTRDYPTTVCNILTHSGPSAGMGPPVDLGGPPYSGKEYLHSRPHRGIYR